MRHPSRTLRTFKSDLCVEETYETLGESGLFTKARRQMNDL